MLKALIWDVDGTLAETERDGHLVAFNQAFAAQGLAWRWSVEHYGVLLRVTGGYERLLLDMSNRADAPPEGAEREALARQLHQAKNRLYAEIVEGGAFPLRPGVARLIDEARHAGIKQAIATTTSRMNVETLLRARLGRGWADAFPVVIAGEDVSRKKPDPQAYRLAVQALGVAPHEAIAIEDSAMGCRSACDAGVPVVITRSVYFAADHVAGAIWIGRDLDTDDDGAPVTLATLQGWHERTTAARVPIS